MSNTTNDPGFGVGIGPNANIRQPPPITLPTPTPVRCRRCHYNDWFVDHSDLVCSTCGATRWGTTQ